MKGSIMKSSNTLYMEELHLGVKQQLAKLGKDVFIEEGADYAKLFAKLGRKYLGALDIDTARDLMTNAFLKVFCENLKQNFKTFSGFYCGRDVTLSGYIANIYARALINEGKSFSLQSTRECSEYDEEGESQIDVMSSGTEVTNRNLGNLKVNLDYIEDELKFLNERLLNDELSEALQKKYVAKITRLTNNKNRLTGNTPIYAYEIDDGIFSAEDDIQFEQLKDNVLDRLENKTNLHIVVLEMLCEGYCPTEIKEYFKLNNSKMSKIMTELKEGIVDYAVERDYELKQELLFTTENGNNFTSRFPASVCKEDLANNIEKLFGFNVAQAI